MPAATSLETQPASRRPRSRARGCPDGSSHAQHSEARSALNRSRFLSIEARREGLDFITALNGVRLSVFSIFFRIAFQRA